MAHHIRTGTVNHIGLTVTDVNRSMEFYQDILGFQKIMDLPRGVLMSNGSVILALVTEAGHEALGQDRFDEFRVGLDHLSFTVESRSDLEEAMLMLDQWGIQHGEIRDLGPDLAMYVLAFRDPDNIQLELTAPHG